MVILTRLPFTGPALALASKELLECLAGIAARGLREKPLPLLYQSRVRYQKEPNSGTGVEEWATPWDVNERGWGDCDDLVIWRVAELRAQGENATVQVVWIGKRFHVRVRRANGSVEDPSRVLLARQGGA